MHLHLSRRLLPGVAVLPLLWAAASAHASCGAAFCSFDMHGLAPGIESGTLLGLRYEYIDQSQPRLRTERLAVGEVHRHHDEIRTRNQNLIASVDHGLGADTAVSIEAPLVRRAHDHIHHHAGSRFYDRWDFHGLGDARLSLSRQHGAWIGSAGVKLPTGRYDRSNDDGQEAERSLQAGSGTTDALLGIAYHGTVEINNRPARGFAQLRAQLPLNMRDEYRHGNSVGVDLGIGYPLSHALQLNAQLNLVVKGRDRGDQAEPLDSGGRFLWLSPGLSANLGRRWQLYGVVQLPLYQRVNGVQLTADWTLAAGLAYRL
jgi:hypothetical protein